MSEEMLELLLADPQFRPAEGWSARAEFWTEERMTASWYTSHALSGAQKKNSRLQKELDEERKEVADLNAEIASIQSRCPDV